MKKKTSITRFEELNWKEIDRLDRDKTIFFQPISPMEEHGPHLPVGTDFMICRDAVIEAIKILKKKKRSLNYILLPGIPIGYSKVASGFPGTISTPVSAIKDIICGVGSSLGKYGFKFLIICTHHMDLLHLKGVYAGIKKIKRKYPFMCIYEPFGPYFYNKIVEKREPNVKFDTSREVHADFRETSVMKYLYPYLVDECYKKLLPVYANLFSIKAWSKTFQDLGVKNGYVGTPGKATIDYGKWYFNEIVDFYAESALKLYEGKKLIELPGKIKMIMRILP
jgi:creatinine amidohydrolase